MEFISKLHLFPEYALLILASRSINELNEIFEKSGTKIRLELHCIMPIEVITMKDYGVKNLKALLWRYNQQNITKDWPLEKETKSKSMICLIEYFISNQTFSGILPLHIFDGNQ